MPAFIDRRRRLALAAWLTGGLLAGCDNATAPRQWPESPAEAQLLTDDVDRFFRAYDDVGRSADVFQRRYLDSASAGLREFAQSRSVTPGSLSGMSIAIPRYLDGIRDWWRTTPNRTSVLATIRANYARLEARYPAAVYPPITVLVGRFTTGGTAGNNGLFIGLEFFGTDAAAPLGELGSFARANQKSWTRDLPTLVAHEHTHFLNSASGSRSSSSTGTLLTRSLNEGVAEFVADQIAGAPTFLALFRQYQARELEFWQAFDREKNGTDISRWLYNQGEATAAWPGDLGYFIGWRIAQAYYNKAADKDQALRDLIEFRDASRILATSGYAGVGPAIR